MVNVTADVGASTADAGRVEVGGSVTSAIQFRGDRDWFGVELAEGRTYKIDLDGGGALHDPVLAGIYDAYGNLIADTTGDRGVWTPNDWVEFIPEANGTYYVSATVSSVTSPTYPGLNLGPYTLSVMDSTDAM